MSRVKIDVGAVAGDFAENKDAARELRERRVKPALENGDTVRLDFSDVSFATQSFIHALLSDVIRSFGPDVLDVLEFAGCNENLAGLIGIVVEYTQETLD